MRIIPELLDLILKKESIYDMSEITGISLYNIKKLISKI